ncbi:hypothetical protein ACI2JA_06040 [Alkalihalobacillus sp. NPDC078783]
MITKSLVLSYFLERDLELFVVYALSLFEKVHQIVTASFVSVNRNGVYF